MAVRITKRAQKAKPKKSLRKAVTKKPARRTKAKKLKRKVKVVELDLLAYKIKTFARLMELSERSVIQEIYDGHLSAIKVRGVWRIPADVAREYLSCLGQRKPQTKQADNQAKSLAE